MKTTTEQMDASQVFCPKLACVARGHVGQGNIISHGKARARYRCKTCGKTFSAQAGTMFEGLRKPKAVIVIVVTLLAYGCPIQAIVQAFGLDEPTVASWRDRARNHCHEVQRAVVQKRTEKKRWVEITRKMVQGTLEQAQVLLSASHGGTVLNTAFIERLNGTIRQRLASLTRKCRHAARRLAALESGMWLLGCTYNLCWPHHELSRQATPTSCATRWGKAKKQP